MIRSLQADVARSKEQLSSQAAAAEAAMKALRQECDKKCAQQKRHITHATAQVMPFIRSSAASLSIPLIPHWQLLLYNIMVS